MNKIGLVILNFLTYEDSLDTIKSLHEFLVDYIHLEVYLVDNKTNDKRYIQLQSQINRLGTGLNIHYLSTEENIGFARGMNLGIDQARKDGCNFVICSNSDIVYKKKIDFNHFIDLYEKDKSIAVIGPSILTLNGADQNPYMVEDTSQNGFKSKIKKNLIFTNPIGKILFFLIGYLRMFKHGKKSQKQETLKDLESQQVYALHGAYFVLTPAYFELFENLDPNTFLYNEELILAERVKQNGLNMYYLKELEVCHKDDSSTNEMLGKKSFKKINFVLNENYKSRSYLFRAYKK